MRVSDSLWHHWPCLLFWLARTAAITGATITTVIVPNLVAGMSLVDTTDGNLLRGARG